MNKIFYIIFFTFSLSFTFSQSSKFSNQTKVTVESNQQESVFKDIEAGIKDGKVENISKYFGQQTYFSFSNGINGYYSSNQAFYVLEDFFRIYKVTSFKFEHIKNDKFNSYATGKYNYDNKGQRSTAQVYISIKKVGPNWIITQFTIN
ncbi:MAG: DUF4783 domain-containing protein [Ignavibacteriaceae bacterium]|jgi:hypothetical protein|nr:DUF4783 domain-containing protein [Ignavibacteriaceae bacterium]